MVRLARWVVLATVLLAGCRRHPPTLPPPLDGAAESPTVEATFDELYPMFLLRKIAPGPKAQLWSRYQGRWVRWTGTLVSVNNNGATFRHIPSTITFDVSVKMDPGGRERIRRFKIGDKVVYVAQLDRFESIFRTFYLVHGDVLAP